MTAVVEEIYIAREGSLPMEPWSTTGPVRPASTFRT